MRVYSAGMLSAGHSFRSAWELLQLLIFILYAVFVPFSLCYDVTFDERLSLTLMIVDIISFCLLLCDLYFRFKYFHNNTVKPESKVAPDGVSSGTLTRGSTTHNIAKQNQNHINVMLGKIESKDDHLYDNPFYYYSLTFMDILAIIPYPLFVYSNLVIRPYMRLPRLLRAIRVPENLSAIILYLETHGIVVDAGFHRIMKLLVYFIVLTHWVGCGFFTVGLVSVNAGNEDSWILNDGVAFVNETSAEVIVPDPLHAYVRSLYWATITMVTVGLGDIVPAGPSAAETAYTVMTMYLGMMMTCIFIGNLTNLVANLDAAEDEFYRKLDNLDKYMSYRNLSQELRQRIRAYYSYMWASLKGIDEKQFLNDLPAQMRLQVAGLRSKYLVQQISFLRNQKEPLLNAICFALEQVVVSPGDLVVQSGTAMHGVFFLCRGEAESLKPGTQTVLQTLSAKSGSVIGEYSLFFKGNHKESIRAKSYCEFFFLPSEKFKKLVEEFLNHGELEKMKEDADKSAKRVAKVKKFFGLDMDTNENRGWRRIFEPKSRFREYWTDLCIVGVLYNITVIPLRIAFVFDLSYGLSAFPQMFIIDWIFDFLFAVDILFRARYFGFLREGVLITDTSYIFLRYRANENPLLDFIIFLPLDLLAMAFVGTDFTVISILRVTKMLHFAFLSTYYNIIKSYFERRRIVFTNSVHRIFKIFFVLFMIVHWVGCGWVFMAKLTQNTIDDENCNLNGTELEGCRSDWVTLDEENWPLIKHDNKMVTYLRAIYFVLVDMTTVGYGDLVPITTGETAYVVVITLVGGFMYPAVVGAMAALLSNLNAAQADFMGKINRLGKYMELKEFPLPLRTRINRFYDYLWSRQRGVDEDFILNDLPGPLRMSVQEYINGSIIRNVPFFTNCDPEMLRHLLSVLKPAVFLPGDTIIRAGELGQEMFLLERGGIKVTSADGKMVYAVLAPGDYFGEGCLLKTEARTATVRAIGYCDCFVLHKEEFDRVSRNFPKCRVDLLESLKDTLNKKKVENGKYMKNLSEYTKLSQITSMQDDKVKTVPHNSFRHPESNKKSMWNITILCIIFYNIVLVPLRLSFEVIPQFLAVDFLFDLIIFIDVVLRYSYFGFIRDGQIFTDVDDIKENYRKTRQYRLDFLIIFPYEILVVLILIFPALMESTGAFVIIDIARVPKLLLAGRMLAKLKFLDRLLESSEIVSGVVYKLFKLLVSVFIVSHYAACFFYLVTKVTRNESQCFDYLMNMTGNNDTGIIDFTDTGFCPLNSLLYVNDEETFIPEDIRNDSSIPDSRRSCGVHEEIYCDWKDTWIELQMKWGLLPLDGGSEAHRYIRALNWAAPTLVVVVIGDVVPVTVEGTLYVTIGILFGVIVNANIIGNIANLVANLEGASAQFREKIDRLEGFLVMHDLPPEIQLKLHNYYEYLWETRKGYSETLILEDMPSTLRAEVASFLKLKYVKDCPIFSDCDIALQKAVSFGLRSRVYSPDDFIINQGDLGLEMFFVVTGTVQMVVVNDSWSVQSVQSETEKSGGSQLSMMNNGSRRNAPKTRRLSVSTTPHLSDDNGEAGLIVLCTQGAGAFFGETSVFLNERRSCSVLAIDYTETYVLNRDHLNELMIRYPFEQEKMYAIIKNLRESNMARNAKVKQNFIKASREGHRLYRIVREHLNTSSGGKSVDNETGPSTSVRRGSISSGSAESLHQFSSRRVGRAASRSSRRSISQTGSIVIPKKIEKARKVSMEARKSKKSIPFLGSKSPTGPTSQSHNAAQMKRVSISSVHPRPSSFTEHESQQSRPLERKIISRSHSYDTLDTHETPSTIRRRQHDRVVLSLERISQKKRKRTIFRKQIFLPYSDFVTNWNMFYLIGTVYYSVSLPYRLAFYVPGRSPFLDEYGEHYLPPSVIAWICFDYIFDLFFLVDILMRSRYFAVYKFGKLYTDSGAIFETYKRSWLRLDILSCFPVEIIFLFDVQSYYTGGFVTLISYCRLNRGLKALHLVELLSTIIRYIHARYPGTNSSMIQVVKILFFYILVNHWYACIWFIIHRFIEPTNHNTWAIVDSLATYNATTGRHNVMNEDVSSLFCWIRAFYFVITTLSSVGYGDIRPYTKLETIFEIVVVLSGACLFAAIIGTVAMWCFFNDSRGYVAFKSQIRKFKEYMNFRELPFELQDQIIRHFTSLWNRERGVKFEHIRKEIPKPLQLELSICVNKDIIQAVKGFRTCHIHVQQHIARVLIPQICGAGDYVYRAGEIGHEIYFVLHGEVQLSKGITQKRGGGSRMYKEGDNQKGNEKPSSRLVKSGGYFGGDTLYSISGERVESALCTQECELYHMQKFDFEDILMEFPEHATVGVFRELVERDRKTVFQKKVQLEDFDIITGNTQHMSPLDSMASRMLHESNANMSKTSNEIATRLSSSTSTAETPKKEEKTKTKDETELLKLKKNNMRKSGSKSRRGSVSLEDIEDKLSFLDTRKKSS